MNKIIERAIYLVGLAIIVASLVFPMNGFLSIMLFVFSMGYLVAGWILLNPARNRKFDFIYFLVGYCYSSTFIAFLFINRDYPMQSYMMYGSIALLVFSLILILGPDRARKSPVRENAVKTALLLVVVLVKVLVL